MKRFLCLIIVGCIFIAIISGCNSDKKLEQTSDPSSESNITTELSNTASQSEQDNEYKIEPVNFEISAKCDFLPDSSFGVFSYNNKYGLINSDGKVVIEPLYEKMSVPFEGYLIAQKSDNLFCVLTTDGEEMGIIEYSDGELESAEPFSEGLAFVHIRGTNALGSTNSICVDTKGNVVFKCDINITNQYVNSIAIGTQTELYSEQSDIVAIDKNGKEIWRRATCNMGLNTVVTDIKIKDNIVVYQSPESMLWGAVDINGNDILDCSYEELTYAGDGKIGFKKYGLWGYLDYNGNVIIEPKYTKAYDFRGGIALVSDNGGMQSIIDESGNILFYCSEKAILYFENGIVMDNSSKIIDSNGNVLYETDISQNGMGGTANGLSYQGGKVFYEFLRGEGVTNNNKTYNYFKIVSK